MTLLTSCTNEEGYKDISLANSAVKEVSGDWVVEVLRDDVHFSDAIVTISNTSDNSPTQIVINDHDGGWGLKAIANVDIATKTFSVTDATEYYYDVTVTITNGTIIPNGGTTPDGRIVDAISFTAVFSDVPTRTFVYTGYRRTGFLEDE
ncbi:lipid-binding protein [Mariniflexile sp. HNIBRBA6329]|uniref:lipid-binding protein n=1 Tax=Mariniflexile sp. HNIBRBA6329 TaxID=3373088 RepID=UPI003744C85D